MCPACSWPYQCGTISDSEGIRAGFGRGNLECIGRHHPPGRYLPGPDSWDLRGHRDSIHRGQVYGLGRSPPSHPGDHRNHHSSGARGLQRGCPWRHSRPRAQHSQSRCELERPGRGCGWDHHRRRHLHGDNPWYLSCGGHQHGRPHPIRQRRNRRESKRRRPHSGPCHIYIRIGYTHRGTGPGRQPFLGCNWGLPVGPDRWRSQERCYGVNRNGRVSHGQHAVPTHSSEFRWILLQPDDHHPCQHHARDDQHFANDGHDLRRAVDGVWIFFVCTHQPGDLVGNRGEHHSDWRLHCPGSTWDLHGDRDKRR